MSNSMCNLCPANCVLIGTVASLYCQCLHESYCEAYISSFKKQTNKQTKASQASVRGSECIALKPLKMRNVEIRRMAVIPCGHAKSLTSAQCIIVAVCELSCFK